MDQKLYPNGISQLFPPNWYLIFLQLPHQTFGRSKNFTQLDIATSALYRLAAPSTPKSVRQKSQMLKYSVRLLMHYLRFKRVPIPT